jgi:hypothetical protein
VTGVLRYGRHCADGEYATTVTLIVSPTVLSNDPGAASESHPHSPAPADPSA